MSLKDKIRETIDYFKDSYRISRFEASNKIIPSHSTTLRPSDIQKDLYKATEKLKRSTTLYKLLEYATEEDYQIAYYPRSYIEFLHNGQEIKSKHNSVLIYNRHNRMISLAENAETEPPYTITGFSLCLIHELVHAWQIGLFLKDFSQKTPLNEEEAAWLDELIEKQALIEQMRFAYTILTPEEFDEAKAHCDPSVIYFLELYKETFLECECDKADAILAFSRKLLTDPVYLNRSSNNARYLKHGVQIKTESIMTIPEKLNPILPFLLQSVDQQYKFHDYVALTQKNRIPTPHTPAA